MPPGPPATVTQPEAPPAPEPPKVAEPEAEPVEPVPPPEPEPAPEPEPVKIPDPIPIKKAEAPEPKVYKPKTSLKKKTFKPKRTVKKAVERIDKKVAKQPSPPKPDPVASAIAKMREKVAQTGQNPRAGGGGIQGNARALEMIDIYRQTVPFHIQKNWAYVHQLARAERDLETVVVLKILASGEIANIWFEKKSGNRFLDDSAYKAVQKSNPLPPLPTGYRRPFYEVGVIFTPEGIQ
jgi:colicin import membrane protein